MGITIAFSFLFFLLIVQRLLELKLSKKNEKWLLANGGKFEKDRAYPFMVMTHIGWFILILIELFNSPRDVGLVQFFFFLVLFIIGQSLRILAIKSLKNRWSVRVVSLPNCAPVKAGIFSYFRHPNYIGVVIEIFSFPMIMNLKLTAILISIINAIVLFVRIYDEEKSLQKNNNYFKYFKKSWL